MVDKLSHASPLPESNIRQSSFSSSMTGLDGEKALIVRRRRLRLRRIKSVALIKSKPSDMDGGGIISGENRCTKRKRDNGFSIAKREKFSPPALAATPLLDEDRLPETEVIIAGKSSYERVEGNRKDEDVRKITCCSHGSVSVIGRRREMEDTVAVEQGFLRRGAKKYDFFGVYDGHGGSLVALACRLFLHKLVAEHAKEEGIDYEENETVHWEKVMTSSFKRMDEDVNKSGSMVAMIGSTAVVAVVGEKELVVANCGDSRAVLSRGGVAVALSDDHKPDRPDELERIQSCGGKVINWNGQRVLGVLATSRSIGDHYLKPFVIPEPEVKVTERTDEDEFLILASDGLWDVISNDIACQLVRKCLAAQMRKNPFEIIGKINGREVADFGKSPEDADSRAARAAALLAELAFARGSRDNISIIVIELKKRLSDN